MTPTLNRALDRSTQQCPWKGIGYLLLRFPAGIATFTVAVTLVSVSLGMTFAPVYMWTSDSVTWGSTTFDPFWWSFLLVPIGAVLVFVSLHLMNALATVCAQWTGWSIGGHELDEAPAPTIRPGSAVVGHMTGVAGG